MVVITPYNNQVSPIYYTYVDAFKYTEKRQNSNFISLFSEMQIILTCKYFMNNYKFNEMNLAL